MNDVTRVSPAGTSPWDEPGSPTAATNGNGRTHPGSQPEPGPAGRLRFVELTDGERIGFAEAVTEQLLTRVASGEIEADTPEFFDAAEIVEGALPRRARAALAALRRGCADAIVVRGLPLDSAPGATPHGHGEHPKPQLAHAVIALCIRRLGHELAYALEKGGMVVQDVHPTQEGAATQSNASWKVDLSLHTENAFHAIRPDYVALYCVRAPNDPPATRLALLDDVLAQLPDSDIDVLRERRFTIRVVDSFRFEGERDLALPATPLEGSLRRPTIRWHESLRATDEVAARVADTFAAAAKRVAREVPLRPSDLLAFANDRCLHGRARFDASLDGRDRWLLRAYALRDARRTAAYVAPARPRVVQLDLAALGGG